MARIERVILTDDIDGSEAASTLQFGVNGRDYEIDLSAENLEKFHSALEEFVSAASQTKKKSKPATGGDADRIRQWAAEVGMEVNPRGRLKKEVVEAYRNRSNK